MIDAESGTSDGSTLTLTGLDPAVVMFSDRPQRLVRKVAVEDFVSEWASYGFDTVPPNAAVTWRGEDDLERSSVIELTDPNFDGEALSFSFDLSPIEVSSAIPAASDEMLPESFEDVSVFVDNAASCSSPLTMTIQNDNHEEQDDSTVFVMLTGNDTVEVGPNDPDLINKGVPLDTLQRRSEHTYFFELACGITAGLLWISYGKPVDAVERPDVNNSDIRFANVEIAYPGQGDMTNVDQYSIAIGIQTFDTPDPPAGKKPRDSSDYSGFTDCILADFEAEFAANQKYGGDLEKALYRVDGKFVRIVSPSHAVLDSRRKDAYPSLLPHVESMKDQTIRIRGHFGNNEFPQESGWYDYTGTFDANSGDFTGSGTIAASDQEGPGASQGLDLSVTAEDLALGTYTQSAKYSVAPHPPSTKGDPVPIRPKPARPDGAPEVVDDGATTKDSNVVTSTKALFAPADVGAAITAPNGNPIPAGSTITKVISASTVEISSTATATATNVSLTIVDKDTGLIPNDVYESIYRDLVAAFTWGYWGGKYGDSNENFVGKDPFAAARPATDTFLGYSPYSAVLFRWTRSYSMPFGESYGSGGHRSPLLDAPIGGEWRMIIHPDTTPGGCARPPGSPAPTTSEP